MNGEITTQMANEQEKLPLVYISKMVKFSAAHRLHSKRLSDEQNKKVFGKCNHVNGHGHNYKVDVMLRGRVNVDTGMVYNLSDLQQVLEKAVVYPCDHKNLDLDVPFFKQHSSTTENLAVFLWGSILTHLSHPHLLHQITIHETDNNSVVYRGE